MNMGVHGGFTESFRPEHLRGNVKKRDATNFGTETPSKCRKTASSVPSTSPSTSSSLSTLTDVESQIWRKYRRYS